VAFYDRFLEHVRAIPGVREAGVAAILPLSGSDMQLAVEIEGRPVPQNALPNVAFNTATPGLFGALGMRLKGGRQFTVRDDSVAPPVVIVNEAFVRRYFPDGHGLGKRIRLTISVTPRDSSRRATRRRSARSLA
jgi:putative ABC transport system permease protein